MEFRQWIFCVAALLTANGSSALDIKNCSSGERYVREYTTVRVTCGQCSSRIAWYVGDDKDNFSKYVGNCTKTYCAVQDKSAFRLNASKTGNKFESILRIVNISRMDAIVVSCNCSAFNNEYKDSASCKLLIKAPISIVPGSCSVQLSDSNVYGVCTLQWLPHRNTFICNWRLTYKNDTHDLVYLQEPATSATQDFGFYKRTNCTFLVAMPVDEGDYIYSIRVSAHPADHFSKTLYIGNAQTHSTGVIYGIAAAAVILAVIAPVIIGSIVKRRIVIRRRKTPTRVVRYAAPSGDLYTIVGTATEHHGEDEYVTLHETIRNDVHGAESSQSPQASTAAQQPNKYRKAFQSRITSKFTRKAKNIVNNETGTCYVNVTDLPTGSGFGVNDDHWRPWFCSTKPDPKVDSAAENSEDDYNSLQFQVNSFRHEDHDNNYSRLDLK